MAADEKQLRLALSIVSGRKAELSADDYEALGYNTYSFDSLGKPSPDEVKQRAEEIFLDAIFNPQESESGQSSLAPDETIIQDACGDGAVEVCQGNNYVFLDEDNIAAIIATKFELQNFDFDDLLDMLREWEERGRKRRGTNTTQREPLTQKACGAIFTYLTIFGYSPDIRILRETLYTERMPHAKLYKLLEEAGYRYKKANQGGLRWYNTKYDIVKINPEEKAPEEGHSSDG